MLMSNEMMIGLWLVNFAVLSVSDPSWVEVHTFCECNSQGLEAQQPFAQFKL